MTKENIITQSIPGGFSMIASSFIVESLNHMVSWLIVSCAVILCDLAFGVRKSFLMGEKVRFSHAIRATMGKMVTYFAFVCMVCMINVAAGNEYSIDRWSCLLVCFIEGCSIIGNILKPKGIDLDWIAAISVLFKKVFSVDKEDIKEVFKEEEEDSNGKC